MQVIIGLMLVFILSLALFILQPSSHRTYPVWLSWILRFVVLFRPYAFIIVVLSGGGLYFCAILAAMGL